MIDAGCALIDLEANEVIQTWGSVPQRIDIPDIIRVDGAEIGWVSEDKKYKLGALVANDPPSDSYRIVSEELTVQYTTVKAKRGVATREYEDVPVVDTIGDKLKAVDAAETIEDIKVILRSMIRPVGV